MALIVPHSSQQGIQSGNAGQAASYRSAGEFMSPGQAAMPQALSNFAGAVNKLGGVVFDEEIRQRREAQHLELITDLQSLQAGGQKYGDDYRQQNRGRDALNAERDAHSFYSQRMDELRGKWNGNKSALAVIERQGGSIASAGVNALRDYGSAQLEAFKDSTFASDKAIFTDTVKNLASTPDEVGAAYATFTPRFEAYLISKGLDARRARAETATIMREAVDARTQAAFLAALEKSDIEGAQKEIGRMKGQDAGDFAAQFESGGAGSYAIGHDAVGGTSYGKYQFSSKAGTVDMFIAWAEKNGGKEVAAVLRDAGKADTGGKAGAMPEAWAQLVDLGVLTEEMQDAFAKEKFVEPVLKNLTPKARDAAQNDPAMMRALWSTAVHHGAKGAEKLFRAAWETSGGETGAFLDALYEARKNQFPSSTPEVREGIANRLDRERGLVGVSSAVSPDKVARYERLLDIKKYSIACKAMDPDAAIDWAVKNIEDAGVQASVIAEQKKRAGLEEYQKRRDLLSRLETAYDGIRKAETPREAQDIIDTFPPEEQKKLDVVARRKFSGELTITDQAKKGEFITRLVNGDTDINLKAEYGDSFSDMDMAWAEKTMAEAERKNRLISTVQLFNVYAENAGLKSKYQREKAISLFQERVDRENADTTDKKRAILFDMLRKVRVPGTLWGTNDEYAYKAYEGAAEKKLSPAETAARIREVPDAEVPIRPQVRQDIIKKIEYVGKQPTEELIREMFLFNRKKMGWL